MQKCITTDFELKVPDDWLDRSMISWVSPPRIGQQIYPNVLCAKDTLKPNETLDKFVNRQLQDALTKLPDFVLLRREKVKLRGRDAVDLEFEITMNSSSVRQRQVYFISNEKQNRVSNIVITASTSDFDNLKDQFSSIIGSVEFNE